MQKPTVYFIVGATATGKTDAAVSIAKRMNGEVVSADAIQIYRQLSPPPMRWKGYRIILST